jgi:hypothetical protein
MTTKTDAAAARAAAEAARRRAEEAARRAAEAAARRAAEAAARKQAEAGTKKVSQASAQKLSQAAGQRPAASGVRQVFGKDELSQGRGGSLRARAAQLGVPSPVPSAPSLATRTASLNELRAMLKRGDALPLPPRPGEASSLRSEVRGDGVANCLEKASALAKPGDQVVLLRDQRDATGHAIVQRRDGSVVDPNAPERPYASIAEYQRQQPQYRDPVAVKDRDVEAVLRTPPGGQRDALISRLGLDAAASRQVADAAPTTATTSTNPVTARAETDAETVQQAWDDVVARGGSQAEAAAAASQRLEDLVRASDDPAYQNALVQASADTLDEVTSALATNARDEGLTSDADKARIKDAVRSLSDVATETGQIGTFLIADQLAQKLPDDAELMHVDDGFYEHVDDGGGPELFSALASRLEYHQKGDARDGLLDDEHRNLFEKAWDGLVDFGGDVVGAVGDGLGAVAGFAGDVVNGALNVVGDFGEGVVDVARGTLELAGNAADWTQDQVMAAAEYAAENGLKLAGEALNWVGDHARELAAEALDIDGQLANLNSPGDSVTLAVGGSVGLTTVQAGAEVEMTITKTEDGYEMTLTGQVSGGVFAGLNIPGFSEAQAEANATGIATATMKFDSLDEVTQAAETVGGIGVASAIGGPAGALLTGATAAEEVSDIVDHFESGSIGLELSAEAKAELGDTAGLGFGGEVSGVVTTGARIELTRGQPPALVLEQSLEASGSLALGAPVDIPSLGGTLNGGSLDGSASVTAETRVPLPEGFSVGDLARDPVGAMREVGQTAIDEATTKLSIEVDIAAGVATEDLPLNLGANGGLEIELSGEAKTKDLVGALGTALRGDLGGALRQLGEATTLEVGVSSYTEGGFSIDEEVTVPGFKIGVKAENTQRDETELWTFEGSPAELAAEGFTLFNALQLNVS